MVAAERLLARWPLIVAGAVSLHLVFGVLDRGLWKPDEPREAAIAAHMARPGADRVVPHLGDAPFCEKPPLYYWVAAGSFRLLGPGAAAARLPNLIYALAAALLVGFLARAAAGQVAALGAGLLMGTFYLAYRVEIWIATDALLMMSVAGALLGCYRGLTARRGWPKLAWYTVMHAFLAAGFLAKNAVAWMVPALALFAFVVWERRWRELVAWELLAPLAVQAAAIVPWVAAVAARPEGAGFLKAFFFNNLVGRFTEVPGVGYARSHPGSPGTYLLQLPVLVLPWSFLVVAAAAAAWRRSSGGDRRSAWRFAVVSIVPGLLVLSAAATARDIYAAVVMPGFALLGGLSAHEAVGTPGASTGRWRGRRRSLSAPSRSSCRLRCFSPCCVWGLRRPRRRWPSSSRGGRRARLWRRGRGWRCAAAAWGRPSPSASPAGWSRGRAGRRSSSR